MGRPLRRFASPLESENEMDVAQSLVPDAEPDGMEDVKSHTSRVEALGAPDGGVITESDDDEGFIAARQALSNKRSTTVKNSKKGGFQSMGLNPALLKAISRKGFTVPTPIQRKTIPLILDSQDVVGMARTGSGKTAAFVIPMLEKLKSHSVKVGTRAIVLSPSRELALQTLKAVKEFGKGTDLRSILLVGGDSLEDQFGYMANNPDIVIATPGRFLHLIVEMSLDLSSVRYVVFDEADRLFEMGFASQLTEILHSLPPSRQTLLFSATLPSNLVAFAQAGLREPTLVRLDAESKISPDLENVFFTLKNGEKEGALLHILQDIIEMPVDQSHHSISTNQSRKRKREPTKPSAQELPTAHSTMVFAATKHHVEYLTALLHHQGFQVSFVYGSLDQTARRSQVEKFRAGETTILVVTDVAARGIDIPLLANVINYDFPSQPKVFVHRVGRTARAGRKGWSYSLVQNSDLPYLLDLQLFLGRKLVVGRNQGASADFSQDIALGKIPNSKLEGKSELISRITDDNDNISGLKTVALKGEKLYTRTRNAASLESVRRAKVLGAQESFQEANSFYEETASDDIHRDNMLAKISAFRPAETVFELGNAKGNVKTDVAGVAEKMRAKRKAAKMEKQSIEVSPDSKAMSQTNFTDSDSDEPDLSKAEDYSDEELEITYSNSHKPNGAHKDSWRDEHNFMSYKPTQTNVAEERGFGVHTGSSNVNKGQSFQEKAQSVSMDLGTDDSRSFAQPSRPRQMRWDKRGKKYVSRDNDEDGSKGRKMVRGESGQKIAASFRSGRFNAWKKLHKLDRLPKIGEQESSSRSSGREVLSKQFKHHAKRAPKLPDKYRDDYYKKKKKFEANQVDGKSTSSQLTKKRELRGIDDVRKERHLKQKRREKNARPSSKSKKAR